MTRYVDIARAMLRGAGRLLTFKVKARPRTAQEVVPARLPPPVCPLCPRDRDHEMEMCPIVLAAAAGKMSARAFKVFARNAQAWRHHPDDLVAHANYLSMVDSVYSIALNHRAYRG